MITPHEKARELVDKFVNHETLKDFGGMDIRLAKAYACLCVDGIISELSIINYGMQYLTQIDYWEGVKQEIERL